MRTLSALNLVGCASYLYLLAFGLEPVTVGKIFIGGLELCSRI